MSQNRPTASGDSPELPLVSLIAAVADNGVIGADGALPWHLPADLKHFRNLTTGKPIVMGRRTYDSIGRALPERRNIVLSRRADFTADGIERADDLDHALRLAGPVDEVMIIGGRAVYRDALPRAGRLYLTQIHEEFSGDTCFPSLSIDEWVESDRLDVPPGADRQAGFGYSFVTLERRAPPPSVLSSSGGSRSRVACSAAARSTSSSVSAR